MVKKLIAIGLIAAMFPLCAHAEDSVTIKLNGENMQLDQEPFIDDGNTLVPLRAIFEALGAEVRWNETDRKIYSEKNDRGIVLKIDSHEMYVYTNILISSRDSVCTTVTLEKAPVIVDDFTYVPLRAVAEAFNAVVDWDGDTKTVLISTAEKPEESEEPAEPTIEPTTEPTAEPTESVTEPTDTTDEVSVYEKMYEGTGYVFERNIPELTCDFEENAGGFKESQHCVWGKDSNGNGVLYVQKETRKQEIHTETQLTLPHLNSYVADELIDISFDIYCPPSNGKSSFKILGSGESVIDAISITNNGKKLDGFSKMEDINAADYFSNNTQGNAEDINIENGAHVNALINPAGSKITITITSKSGDAEPIVINDSVSAPFNFYRDMGTNPRVQLLGYKITADYYSNSLPMIVDNIVTNIVKKAE